MKANIWIFRYGSSQAAVDFGGSPESLRFAKESAALWQPLWKHLLLRALMRLSKNGDDLCWKIGRWGKVVWVCLGHIPIIQKWPKSGTDEPKASSFDQHIKRTSQLHHSIILDYIRCSREFGWSLCVQLNHMDCLQPSMANDTQPHFKWVLWKQIPAPDVLKFTKTLHLRSKVQVLIVHCKLVAWTWQVYQQKRFCKLLLEVPYIIYINLYSRFD